MTAPPHAWPRRINNESDFRVPCIRDWDIEIEVSAQDWIDKKLSPYGESKAPYKFITCTASDLTQFYSDMEKIRFERMKADNTKHVNS